MHGRDRDRVDLPEVVPGQQVQVGANRKQLVVDMSASKNWMPDMNRPAGDPQSIGRYPGRGSPLITKTPPGLSARYVFVMTLSMSRHSCIEMLLTTTSNSSS